jgi:membrane associated rhomboid family serine protease
VFLPFLHRDFPHIFNNSIPLLVLCTLLSGSRANSASVVCGIMLVSGILIWFLAPNGTNDAPLLYVGASALIFGLVTFLISSGIFERRMLPVAIAIVVGLMYGGTLFYELTFLRALFSQQRDVSWSARVYGAVAGVAVAFILTHDHGRAWISRNAPQLEDHLPKSRLG